MDIPSLLRPLAGSLALASAACSSGSALSGGGSLGDYFVTNTTAPDGGGVPTASAFAYYAPSLPGDDATEVLEVIFTTQPDATCGSMAALILADQGILSTG